MYDGRKSRLKYSKHNESIYWVKILLFHFTVPSFVLLLIFVMLLCINAMIFLGFFFSLSLGLGTDVLGYGKWFQLFRSSTIVWWIATSNDDPKERRLKTSKVFNTSVCMCADPIFLLWFDAKVFIDTNFKTVIGKIEITNVRVQSQSLATHLSVIVCIF